MVTAWETIDDPRALGEALEGISTLAEILERERTAVAALDPARLAELADEKGPLVERLRRLSVTPVVSPRLGAAAGTDLQHHVRTAAVRLAV